MSCALVDAARVDALALPRLVSSCLRLMFPELTVVGIDTHGSVVFGLSDAGGGRMPRFVETGHDDPAALPATVRARRWREGARALDLAVAAVLAGGHPPLRVADAEPAVPVSTGAHG